MEMTADIMSEVKGFIDNFLKADGLTTREDQFIWVRNNISQYIPEMYPSNPTQKSASDSEKNRTEGNKHFKSKLYKKALDLYTKSMLAAPSTDQGDNNDKHLAMALSNRSAALFYLKEYEACLTDIEGALEAGYREEGQYLLHSRKVKCLHALQRGAEAKLAFAKVVEFLPKSNKEGEEQTRILKELEKYLEASTELSNSQAINPESIKVGRPSLPCGKNVSHPSLSSSCKVMYHKDKGRYVIATRDIIPGEIILVEEPYSYLLYQSQYEDHCDNCCGRLSVAPIACKHCTKVLYCNSACRDYAWSRHHMYECSMDTNVYFSGANCHLSFRTAVVTGLDELLKYKDKSTSATTMYLDMEGCNGQGQYRSCDFNTINHLVDHSSKLPKKTMFSIALTAVLYTRWLENINYFQTIPPEEKEAAVLCVGTWLMHIHQIIDLNSACMMETVCSSTGITSISQPKFEDIGNGLYPTYALLNHSCAANTIRVSYDNNMVVHANTNIKKGQEIATTYVAGYIVCRKEERQLNLQRGYHFKCSCEACVNDWPLFTSMVPQEALFKCQNCQHPLGPSTGYYPHATRVCPCCRQRQVIPAIEVILRECQIKVQEATELRYARKFVEAMNMLKLEIIRLENLLVSPREQNFFPVLKVEFDACCSLMGNIHIKEA